VTEQRLNDVHGSLVVQVFGCKDAPAIVWQQRNERAVRAAGFRVDRDLADAGANGLNASSAGMANALDQIRRRRARTLLRQVPMIANLSGHSQRVKWSCSISSNVGKVLYFCSQAKGRWAKSTPPRKHVQTFRYPLAPISDRVGRRSCAHATTSFRGQYTPNDHTVGGSLALRHGLRNRNLSYSCVNESRGQVRLPSDLAGLSLHFKIISRRSSERLFVTHLDRLPEILMKSRHGLFIFRL